MESIKWPIFVINLERSSDRWANITSALCDESLTRIEGVDGRAWVNGEYHLNGRPKFKDGVIDGLVMAGIFTEDTLSKVPWVPC